MFKCYDEIKSHNINFDHIDLLSIKPLDIQKIYNSVKKTGKLIIFDNSSHKICSVASEIVSSLVNINHKIFKVKPEILTYQIYITNFILFNKELFYFKEIININYFKNL